MDPSASEAIFNHSRVSTPTPSDNKGKDEASTEPTARLADPLSSSSTEPAADTAGVKREPAVSLAGLENEVTQVMGSLRSFWGGVQKQVAPTLASVRKDLNKAASEAKLELERLQTQAAEARVRGAESDFANLALESSTAGADVTTATAARRGSTTATATSMSDSSSTPTPPPSTSEKGKERAADERPAQQQPTLFSRLQSSIQEGTATSLPSLASFQQSLSAQLKSNPNLHVDMPALRASLTSNFQKLQSDLHLADAEKLADQYLKKSEAVLIHGLKDAGKFLQDAVRIVPPEEGGEQPHAGVTWDGSDVWTLPSPTSKPGSSRILFSQTDAQVSALTGLSTSSVRAKRKDALLHQLRTNQELLLVDPASEAADEDVREAWAKWFKEEVEAKEGGVEGDEWTQKIWAELGPRSDGVEELKATRDELVPSKLTKEQFWTHYFFRVFQIEQDERRRATLLTTAVSQPQDEELFSWDDEEPSEPASATSAKFEEKDLSNSESTLPAATDAIKATIPASTSVAAAVKDPKISAATSPRNSEESYDLVSETSGGNAASRAASTSGGVEDVKKPAATVGAASSAPTTASAAKEESDEDSDWE